MFFYLFFSILISSLFAEVEDFSYSLNGADWGETCHEGRSQSPIDIDTDKLLKCDPNMMIDIITRNSIIQSETQDLKVTLKSFGNFTTLYASDFDGDVYGYDSLQFHFHSPSEHTLNGNYYDIEMHIVHSIRPEFTSKTGRTYAAIGILFEIDDSSTGNPLLENYPTNDKGTLNVNMTDVIGQYISKPVRYFSYSGSLTTPPCTEAVNWYVLETPLKITTAQFKKFANLWPLNNNFAKGKGNNRLTQPLNGRKVKAGGLSSEECKEDFVSFFGFFVLFLFLIYVIFKVVP